MKLDRTFLAVIPLSLLALAACNSSSSSGGSTTSTAASATGSAVPLAAVPPPASASAAPEVAHAPRMRGGPGAMFFRATRELTDLKDPQKASLEKIMDGMKDEGGLKTEFKDFQDELLSEVKAGKVETAKLDPKMKVIDTAMQTRLDKEADNLTQLHNLLEPGQRKVLTTAIRAKQAKMEERATKMKETMGQATPKPEEIAKRKVDRLTKDLELDATQQKSIDGIVAKLAPKAAAPMDMRAEWKKSTDTLLGEFEKDTFDAKKQDFYTGANKKGHAGLQGEIDLLTQVVPVLKQDQRDKLAARLEHPGMMGRGGPDVHGGGGGPEGHMEARGGYERHWAGPSLDEDMGPGPGGADGPKGPATLAPPARPGPSADSH